MIYFILLFLISSCFAGTAKNYDSTYCHIFHELDTVSTLKSTEYPVSRNNGFGFPGITTLEYRATGYHYSIDIHDVWYVVFSYGANNKKHKIEFAREYYKHYKNKVEWR